MIDKWDFIRWMVGREGEDGPRYRPDHIVERMDYLKDRDWRTVIQECPDDDFYDEIIEYMCRNSARPADLYRDWQKARTIISDEYSKLAKQEGEAYRPIREQFKERYEQSRMRYRETMQALLLELK